jgi:hypothetical protein
MVGSITVGWDKGANYLIANQTASFLYRSTSLSAEDAIDRLERAASLAPDVPRYWHTLPQSNWIAPKQPRACKLGRLLYPERTNVI